MKLTKREISKIIDLYDLGIFSNVKEIHGGMVNHNFNLKTDKGDFVVRRLGYQYTFYWRNQKKLQHKVTEYLTKNKFPYQIPTFIKNKNHNYVSRIGKSLFEVYPKIKGRSYDRVDRDKLKESAKALAIFHKMTSKYILPQIPKRKKWLLEEFSRMKKISARRKLDRIMLKNLDMVQSIYQEILDLNLKGRPMIVHGDMTSDNLLFMDNKVVGVIDLENVHVGNKASDVASTITRVNIREWKYFFKEYRKYNSLSKKDEKNILPNLLLQEAVNFWWFYRGIRKFAPEQSIKEFNRSIRKFKLFKKQYENSFR